MFWEAQTMIEPMILDFISLRLSSPRLICLPDNAGHLNRSLSAEDVGEETRGQSTNE